MKIEANKLDQKILYFSSKSLQKIYNWKVIILNFLFDISLTEVVIPIIILERRERGEGRRRREEERGEGRGERLERERGVR